MGNELTTQKSRGLFLFHCLLTTLLQNLRLDICCEQRCNFVPDQISDSCIAMGIDLSVKLQIVLGGIDVVGKEVEHLNKLTDNKITEVVKQS